LEEIIFENFNIFENNKISVKLAKVLEYLETIPGKNLLIFPKNTVPKQKPV
jgi:hypothetical protein